MAHRERGDLNIDSTNVKLERQKNLVCSMITISENAALKDSNNIELNLCHNCNQQECQDVISMKQKHFSFAIWSLNTISVKVTVLHEE